MQTARCGIFPARSSRTAVLRTIIVCIIGGNRRRKAAPLQSVCRTLRRHLRSQLNNRFQRVPTSRALQSVSMLHRHAKLGRLNRFQRTNELRHHNLRVHAAPSPGYTAETRPAPTMWLPHCGWSSGSAVYNQHFLPCAAASGTGTAGEPPPSGAENVEAALPPGCVREAVWTPHSG